MSAFFSSLEIRLDFASLLEDSDGVIECNNELITEEDQITSSKKCCREIDCGEINCREIDCEEIDCEEINYREINYKEIDCEDKNCDMICCFHCSLLCL